MFLFADLPGFSGVMDDNEDMEIDEGKQYGKAGTKRGSEGGGATAGTTPKKRPAPSGKTPVKTKPQCKYGVKCYQKSKEHRNKFNHPWVQKIH